MFKYQEKKRFSHTFSVVLFFTLIDKHGWDKLFQPKVVFNFSSFTPPPGAHLLPKSSSLTFALTMLAIIKCENRKTVGI